MWEEPGDSIRKALGKELTAASAALEKFSHQVSVEAPNQSTMETLVRRTVLDKHLDFEVSAV